MQDLSLQHWVLRILNGPLQGAEFTLKTRRTLLLVGPQNVFCDSARPLDVPSDALYIALEEGGRNFEVLIDEERVDTPILRVVDGIKGEERNSAIQAIEQVGGLRFALRPESQSWQPGILNQAVITGTPITSSRKRLLLWGGVLAGVTVAGIAFTDWTASRPSPVSEAHLLIKGASVGLEIFSGRDRQLYVFVDSERDAGWSRQAIERSAQPEKTTVLSRSSEAIRLGKRIAQLEPALAWHRIDLFKPAQPRLLLSAQRNLLTPALEKRLTEALIEAAPYATAVSIETADDDLISRQAEHGLIRLALPYRQLATTDNVTFTLQGDLADVQIEAARTYVHDFYRQWGNRFVHFAVELKADPLRDKSFQYGPDGYVKTTPSSWSFVESTGGDI
ncbi:PrgH/EprH family type III secretion apparatus protein [Pseudomonas sp. NPDC090202]|uniref:PrgH/EprH family type III secretion apparatus protein n=1 Tax=unclassified Pseudomonas TaxID=196821 RepID=UPI00382BE1C0